MPKETILEPNKMLIDLTKIKTIPCTKPDNQKL